MRITVDIEQDVLAEAMQMVGETKKSPAVAKVVVEFVRREKMREFGRLAMEGAFDYPLTNDELEALETEACSQKP